MVDPALKDQLLTDLEHLSSEQQQRVAQYAHALRATMAELPPAPRGHDLRHLAGILDPDSAREMREAIEEEFEQIDRNAW